MPTIVEIPEEKALEISALNFYYAGTQTPSLKNVSMAAAKHLPDAANRHCCVR